MRTRVASTLRMLVRIFRISKLPADTSAMAPKLPPVPAICRSAVRARARRGAPDRARRALDEHTHPHPARVPRRRRVGRGCAGEPHRPVSGDRRAEAGRPSHTDFQHLWRHIHARAGLENMRIHDPTTQLGVAGSGARREPAYD